jgi:hypothetical protein
MATVTAIVKDPSGNLYVRSLVIASFVGQSTTPGAGPYITGGVPSGQFQTVIPTETDSFGAFSVIIPGNDTITPTPSQWKFTVVSSTTPPAAFAALITITGSSQDITAALQAAAAALPTSVLGNVTATGLTVTGNSTITGTLSSTGTFTAAKINGDCVVDGVTNLTIQAAITACSVTGGRVFIPTGTYQTGTIVLPPFPEALIIEGAGPGSTIIQANAPNIPIFMANVGVVNTQNAATGGCAANCVTLVSGANFALLTPGPIVIQDASGTGTTFTISSIQSNTVLTLSAAPGTRTNVGYQRVGSGANGSANVEGNHFRGFSVQAHAGSTTLTAGAAIELSGISNTTWEDIQYLPASGATLTTGNWNSFFHFSSFPAACFTNILQHPIIENMSFGPTYAFLFNNQGVVTANSNANNNYIYNPRIFAVLAGMNTVFQARQSAQTWIQGGLTELVQPSTATVNITAASPNVTATAGTSFLSLGLKPGDPITITTAACNTGLSPTTCQISSVTDATHLVLTTNAGTTTTGATATFGATVLNAGQRNTLMGMWIESNGPNPVFGYADAATGGTAAGVTLAWNYGTTPQSWTAMANTSDWQFMGNLPDNITFNNLCGNCNHVTTFGRTFRDTANDVWLHIINSAAGGGTWGLGVSNSAGAMGINDEFAFRDEVNNLFAFHFGPNGGGASVPAFNLNYPLRLNAGAGVGSLLISTTAPTIAGAGCGGSAASIATNNGPASFTINVGTAPLTACTVTLPAATAGWVCHATDITTNSANIFYQKQTASGTTSATITNFGTAATAQNFTANDILSVSCFGR